MDFTQLTKADLVNICTELQKKVEAQQHLAQAVISKDKEIIELNKHIINLKTSAGSFDVLEKSYKTLEENHKKLTTFLNPYILNFRSLLKAIQGSLELGVEMEALLSETLKTKEAHK
jgi:hypothetical protein